MSVAIIDYGAGNLRSVQKAFEKIGIISNITSDISEINGSNGLVLPGVGAFDPAIKELKNKKLIETIILNVQKGKPFLGLCLGMQLLFEKSAEGKEKGLGSIKGEVKKFSGKGLGQKLKVPHMGWNDIKIRKPSPILKGVPDGTKMYFVHSFYCIPSERSDILTETDYGADFVSAVSNNNIYALQFHPEKSADAGLQILKNFGGLCR